MCRCLMRVSIISMCIIAGPYLRSEGCGGCLATLLILLNSDCVCDSDCKEPDNVKYNSLCNKPPPCEDRRGWRDPVIVDDCEVAGCDRCGDWARRDCNEPYAGRSRPAVVLAACPSSCGVCPPADGTKNWGNLAVSQVAVSSSCEQAAVLHGCLPYM